MKKFLFFKDLGNGQYQSFGKTVDKKPLFCIGVRSIVAILLFFAIYLNSEYIRAHFGLTTYQLAVMVFMFAMLLMMITDYKEYKSL